MTWNRTSDGAGAPRASAGEGRPSTPGPLRGPYAQAERDLAPGAGAQPSFIGRGFTLIELMVVMAVVAAMAALAVPAVASLTGANARQAAGELAGSMRALFDVAALRHATCRMAIDPEKRTFWAECARGPAGVSPDPSRADEDALARRFPEADDPEIRKLLDASSFGKYKDQLIRERALPGKTTFGPIHLDGSRGAQDTAPVYVYFFPGGQAQRAWIPVVDGKNVFTVVTEPFTGRARVILGTVEVRE